MDTSVNGYTDSEICKLYKNAKNKKLQMQILKELTLKTETEVIEILEKGGILKLTEEIKQLILEKYKEGLSDTQIARELGLAQSQVSPFLRKQGLESNSKKNEKKEKETELVEKLKRETQRNIEELKEILPKSMPVNPNNTCGANYDIIETLTPQQYYELAKLSLELLKTIWG